MSLAFFVAKWHWLIEVAPRHFSQGWWVFWLVLLGAAIIKLIILNVFIAKRVKGPKKRVIRMGRSWLWTFILVVAFELFMRYQRVPGLSQRMWFALFLVGMAVWYVFILRYKYVVGPRKERDLQYKEE